MSNVMLISKVPNVKLIMSSNVMLVISNVMLRICSVSNCIANIIK